MTRSCQKLKSLMRDSNPPAGSGQGERRVTVAVVVTVGSILVARQWQFIASCGRMKMGSSRTARSSTIDAECVAVAGHRISNLLLRNKIKEGEGNVKK